MLDPMQIDTAKLAQALVEKHHRFIKEYRSEAQEIESKIPGLSDTLSQAKSELEEAQRRIDVLDEKRRLIYHYASAAEGDEGQILSRLAQCNVTMKEEIRIVRDLSKPTATRVEDAIQARQDLESLQSQLPTLESNYEQSRLALNDAEERLKQLRASVAEHEAAAKHWGDTSG